MGQQRGFDEDDIAGLEREFNFEARYDELSTGERTETGDRGQSEEPIAEIAVWMSWHIGKDGSAGPGVPFS
jgi:hypothetical protein